MSSIMYEMVGCGWCAEAKKRLNSSIQDGTIEVKHSSEAPQSVRGFPAFQSKITGKIKEGCPTDIVSLQKDLGHNVVENYNTERYQPVFRKAGYATLSTCWTTKDTVVENYSHCSTCVGAKRYNSKDGY